MIQVRTSSNELLILNDKPMGKGGEGGVYRILTPLKYRDCCVKLYAQPKSEIQKKIDFMVKYPPDFLRQNLKICWPQSLVFDANQANKFLGFLMPMAFPASCSLQTLLVSGHRLDWSQKFNRDTSKGFNNCIALAKNVALVTYVLHQMGDELNRDSGYVIGDLKPDNIMVNENGQVSLIDVDSIQINARNVVFPVSAFSPDYSSPELSTKGNSQPIQTSSDNFTLAIILYRIIVGIHPFMGTVRHRNGFAVQDAIAGGYYVHGRRKNDFEVIPPIHNRLMMAGREVREYFRYALDEGIFNPSIRPSASGWSKMLHEELHSNKFANRA